MTAPLIRTTAGAQAAPTTGAPAVDAGRSTHPRFPSLAPVGVAATVHASAAGAGFAAWHALVATAPAWWATLVSASPALLCAALALTSHADRRQYCARLLAAAVMAPMGVLFWSIDGPARLGTGLAAALAFVAADVAALLLGLRWLAACTTRIDPAEALAPVTPRTLASRLRSLAALGLPIDIRADAPSRSLRLQWQPTNQSERTHEVRLDLQDDAHAVTVIERERAGGTDPASAGEASMRSLGEPAFDPTRPRARRVWMCTAQTTILDAARLAAAPVALVDEHVQWIGPGRPALADTDTLMACLAAIVLRSGWTWRPRLGAPMPAPLNR